MRKVLITGITGFLGSQIAEKLINEGITVIGMKRPDSDIWRCEDFKNQIDWIDIQEGYQKLLIDKQPDTLIHCAWLGVEAQHRNSWTEQVKNIVFLVELLEIARVVQLKKILILGSQAEYGYVDSLVSEELPPVATNAYGSIKLASLEVLKTFAESNGMEWIWLRVFSIFGEKENQNWLIPSIVRTMITEQEMDFTKGEQKYAYLYVKDFAEIVFRITEESIKSGIYNISGSQAKTLRSVIEAIRDIVNPNFKLNFGALSYRPNQSMHVEGNISKLKSEIGEVLFTNFNVALKDTINYYINKKIL